MTKDRDDMNKAIHSDGGIVGSAATSFNRCANSDIDRTRRTSSSSITSASPSGWSLGSTMTIVAVMGMGVLLLFSNVFLTYSIVTYDDVNRIDCYVCMDPKSPLPILLWYTCWNLWLTTIFYCRLLFRIISKHRQQQRQKEEDVDCNKDSSNFNNNIISTIDMVLSDLIGRQKRNKNDRLAAWLFRIVCPWSITVTIGYTVYLLQNDGGKNFIDEDLCYRVIDGGITRQPVDEEDFGPLGMSWESWTSVYLFFFLLTNITAHYICTLMNAMLYTRYFIAQTRKEKREQRQEQEQDEHTNSTSFDEEAKPASQPQPCSEETASMQQSIQNQMHIDLPRDDDPNSEKEKADGRSIVQHHSKSVSNVSLTMMKKNWWLSSFSSRYCRNINLTFYPIVWVILHGVLVATVQTYIDQVYCTDDIFSAVIATTVVFTIIHILLSVMTS